MVKGGGGKGGEEVCYHEGVHATVACSEGSRTEREDTVRVYRRYRPLNREDTVTV